MERKLFKDQKPNSVDDHLSLLERIKSKKEEIINQETSTIKDIRGSFEETVVMFIDMVDSTKFKSTNQDSPEKWILRVRQFSEIVAEYVMECGGRVVKYIGDELMIVFNRKSKINDALNLLNRINELQKDLSEITQEETKIKIALDFGNVMYLKYKGHNEPDPQGTPVDRCARIAKLCKPGIALTSFDLVNNCDNPRIWESIGEIELKGIGLTRIFQFGKATIELIPTIEISEEELRSLKNKLNQQKLETEHLQLKLKDAIFVNKELNSKLTKLGVKADKKLIISDSDSKEEECNQAWNEITSLITMLNKLISSSNVPAYEYSRFLFLHMRGEGWEYSDFKHETFDSSIENNLVCSDNERYWILDPENRRNKKVIQLMDEIEFKLGEYESSCRIEEDDDLFDYSLKTPEFWVKHIGHTVTR